MNFLLGLCAMLGTSCIGYALSHGYKRRLYFLQDMSTFLQAIQSNCAFLQNSFRQVLLEQKNKYTADFDKFLAELCDRLDERKEFLAEWQSKQKVVSKDEAGFIADFFLNFGKLDSLSQIDAIRHAQASFEEKLQKSKQLVSTKGTLSTKLGVIAGIGLFIICI